MCSNLGEAWRWPGQLMLSSTVPEPCCGCKTLTKAQCGDINCRHKCCATCLNETALENCWRCPCCLQRALQVLEAKPKKPEASAEWACRGV